ncbi:MAG: FAD-binding oxidoreductase [Bacteroidetes bacterium]|nr:FAD-binding oxidoreductase [Bacteroidota bacterium]
MTNSVGTGQMRNKMEVKSVSTKGRSTQKKLTGKRQHDGSLIIPQRYSINEDTDAESLDGWGFRDTRFGINKKGCVILLGKRYELSGKELPRLLPWIGKNLGITIDPKEVNRSSYPSSISKARISPKFLAALRTFFSDKQVSTKGEVRLRHGHGHTQEEIFEIKYGKFGKIPDIVVFPETEEQIVSLFDAAKKHRAVLIPYGGGTNVTNALRCNNQESRTIVSVDMWNMNQILWIDKKNHMACIQAGAIGRHITEQLKKYGFTMGHEPDSVEFSTLGGWIATNASGMKKNRYGNIEDIILDVNVVLPSGKIERASCFPRQSVGFDLRQLMFGSEGMLGIITSAIVKIFPLPEVQEYGSVIFPSFEDGFAFMYDLMRESKLPASVRLADNLQFQFGFVLNPASNGLSAWKSRLQKFFITRVKSFNPSKMVACTLVFEGTYHEVEEQKRELYPIASRHHGIKAGAENGRSGYQLTFSIAYIRDFFMKYFIMGESFETSVSWTDALKLCENVKRRVHEEYEKRRLPGRPFISARITQLYQTGVCVYFYFGFPYKGIAEPQHLYIELENAARDEILKCNGSLSHHHGVGKIRPAFLPQIMSPAEIKLKQKLKKCFDPLNILGIDNQNINIK